jgi:hypothetical protein
MMRDVTMKRTGRPRHREIHPGIFMSLAFIENISSRAVLPAHGVLRHRRNTFFPETAAGKVFHENPGMGTGIKKRGPRPRCGIILDTGGT